MSYCEICEKKYSLPTYATSKKHLNSKLHKENLALKRAQPLITPFYELLLFVLLQELNSITYSNILKFFSSFGIKAEIAFRTIIKKLKDGDIIYQGNIDSDYETILQKILEFPKIDYPLTLSVKETYQKFQFLGHKYPTDLVNHFAKLTQKYPEFVSLSSSKIGDPPDLITFKQIFIDRIKFHLHNNWVLK